MKLFCVLLFVSSLALGLVHHVSSQSIQHVSVTSERQCNSQNTYVTGLQCDQMNGDYAGSRYSTLTFNGTITLGQRTPGIFSSDWTVARGRRDNKVQTLGSLHEYSDPFIGPSIPFATSSAKAGRIWVEMVVNPVRLAIETGDAVPVPFGYYYDARTYNDTDGNGDISANMDDPVQQGTYTTGTASTCDGETVQFEFNDGESCASLMGFGGAGDYASGTNINALNPSIIGDLPFFDGNSINFATVSTAHNKRECTAVMCYPCPASGIDEVTIVRALPLGPMCRFSPVLEKYHLVVDGKFIIHYEYTREDGVTEERAVEQPFSNLKTVPWVDDNGQVSTNARITNTTRRGVRRTSVLSQLSIETRDGLLTCTSDENELDMGNLNPYITGVNGYVTTDSSQSQYDPTNAFRVPFFFPLSSRKNLWSEQYTSNDECSLSPRSPTSANYYSDQPSVTAGCSAVDPLQRFTNGYGVVGQAFCINQTETETGTPALVFSAMNQWQVDYLALDDEDKREVEPMPYMHPLWDPAHPNVWIHSIDQKTYILIDRLPPVYASQLKNAMVNFEISVNIHESLIQLLEPGDAHPTQSSKRVTTTAAPIVTHRLSACTFGGLELDKAGLTGLKSNGEQATDLKDIFAFGMSFDICNGDLTSTANYTVKSNCTTPFLDSITSVQGHRIHTENVSIDHIDNEYAIGGKNCYTYTTPEYVASRERVIEFFASNPSMADGGQHALGYCNITITDPTGTVVYQPVIEDLASTIRELLIQDGVDSNVILQVPCYLDTSPVRINDVDEDKDQKEEEDSARWYIFFVVAIGAVIIVVLGVLLVVLLVALSQEKSKVGSDKPKTKSAK